MGGIATNIPSINHVIASTCGPGLGKSVNPDSDRWLNTTSAVLLSREGDRIVGSLYRKSRSVPGWWSREESTATQENGKWTWGPWEKAKGKIAGPPAAPLGSAHTVIRGVDVWTRAEMTQEEAELLMALLLNTGVLS